MQTELEPALKVFITRGHKSEHLVTAVAHLAVWSKDRRNWPPPGESRELNVRDVFAEAAVELVSVTRDENFRSVSMACLCCDPPKEMFR